MSTWTSQGVAAREMSNDADPEMREMGDEEVQRLDALLAEHEEALNLLLLPTDPRDERNIYLEVRAGTGGDEAAIFAGDLHPHVHALRGKPRLAGGDPDARATASTAATRK